MFLIKNTFNEKILFIIILYSIITPLFAEIVQSEKKNAISVYMLAPFFSDMDMTSDNTILNYTNPLLFGFEYNYDNFSLISIVPVFHVLMSELLSSYQIYLFLRTPSMLHH